VTIEQPHAAGDGWRDGMQTACVVLISKRAKAEAEAAQAEAAGYSDVAKQFRLQRG
jgi:hypothetical protein